MTKALLLLYVWLGELLSDECSAVLCVSAIVHRSAMVIDVFDVTANTVITKSIQQCPACHPSSHHMAVTDCRWMFPSVDSCVVLES